ncbi:MAG: glycosyltransferase family 87 protein, partial [Planctomycetota bacterium]|nr:glycosyltransferase family 87 protein [Planctomycetota bacterium]
VTAAVISVHALQIGTQSIGKPGFGVDFELLYTVSALWGEHGNPYDDAALKEAWRAVGDPRLPEPGRPITPNVYPLTVAPLIRPLTYVPFAAAIVIWSGIILASEAWLMLYILRSAAAGPGCAVRRIPIALALTALMLSYPVRLNLASLNIGMVAAALGIYAVQNGRRTWLAGAAFGLSLVKYSVTGPLGLLLLWRRQYRLLGVALAVQVVLVCVATWGGGYRHPLEWVGAMRAEVAHSLSPGAINAHDAIAGGPMHLGFRSLWHRVAPAHDAWHWPLVVLIVGLGIARVMQSPRDETERVRRFDLTAAAVLSVTLLSFYHRAYDLIPLMVLACAWLVRPATDGGVRSFGEVMTWAALIWTVTPGLWAGWDSSSSGVWVQMLVQPACAWSTLGFCLLLTVAHRGPPSADSSLAKRRATF